MPNGMVVGKIECSSAHFGCQNEPLRGAEYFSRHSTSPTRPVILTAVGIQSPSDAPRRLWQRRYPPSFSPRWESRALSMHQDGYGNGDTSRHSHRSGDPEPFRCANTVTVTETPPVILTAVGIQSPFDAPRRLCQRRHPPPSSPQWESRALSMRQHGYTNGDTSRHSHRSGNPEPFRCANTVTVTEIRQVGAQACPLGLLVRAIPS